MLRNAWHFDPSTSLESVFQEINPLQKAKLYFQTMLNDPKLGLHVYKNIIGNAGETRILMERMKNEIMQNIYRFEGETDVQGITQVISAIPQAYGPIHFVKNFPQSKYAEKQQELTKVLDLFDAWKGDIAVTSYEELLERTQQFLQEHKKTYSYIAPEALILKRAFDMKTAFVQDIPAILKLSLGDIDRLDASFAEAYPSLAPALMTGEEVGLNKVGSINCLNLTGSFCMRVMEMALGRLQRKQENVEAILDSCIIRTRKEGMYSHVFPTELDEISEKYKPVMLACLQEYLQQLLKVPDEEKMGIIAAWLENKKDANGESTNPLFKQMERKRPQTRRDALKILKARLPKEFAQKEITMENIEMYLADKPQFWNALRIYDL